MNKLGNFRQRLTDFFEHIRTSFWAIPCLLIGLSVVLAFINLWLDATVIPQLSLDASSWLQFSQIESVRSLLSTTAASILGVAGVSFSITIASLILASQQFGPRLIRTFMRNRFTQTVLGFFVATFLYCMLTIQLSNLIESDSYTPVSTLVTVLLLTVVDLILLVLFIHHTCISIQADSVINEVAKELHQRADSLFMLRDNDAVHDDPTFLDSFKRQFDETATLTLSDRDGYIRSIDYDGLLVLAEEKNFKIQVLQRAGDHVMVGSALYKHVMEVAGDQLPQPFNEDYCIIGDTRTPQQDIEYTIRQLVEIALRALSPGINDPFTAMTCIDKVGSLINFMASKQIPSVLIRTEHNLPKLLVNRTTFDGLVNTAFDQIRQNAVTNVDVLVRILEILNKLASFVPEHKQTAPLLRQAEQIHENIDLKKFTKSDSEAISSRYDLLNATIAKRFVQTALPKSS